MSGPKPGGDGGTPRSLDILNRHGVGLSVSDLGVLRRVTLPEGTTGKCRPDRKRKGGDRRSSRRDGWRDLSTLGM